MLKARRSIDGPFFLTEYNVGCCLGYPSHDDTAAAAFIFRAVAALNDELDVYSYWTFNDVFEEGGLPLIEYKNIYGAMTVHGIPKPAWRAFQLLHQHAGDRRLPVTVMDDPTTSYCNGKCQPNSSYISAFATYRSTVGVAGSLSVFVSFWGNPDPLLNSSNHAVQVLLGHANDIVLSRPTAWLIDPNHANSLAEWWALDRPSNPNPSDMAKLQASSKVGVIKDVAITPINATLSSLQLTLMENTAIVLAFS